MTSWRDILRVHPAAELFPPMGPDELRALGEDIKKANGLTSPITFWCPAKGYGYCSGSKHYVIDGPFLLLDGRNRLDAMELVGIPVVLPKYSPKRIGEIAAGFSDKALETFKKDNPAWAEQKIMDFVGPASAEKLQRCKDARVFDYKNIRYNILFEKITPAPEHKVPKNYNVGDPYAYVMSTNIHRRHLVNPREMTAKLLEANPERSDRETAKLAGTSHPTVAAVRKELETGGKILPPEKRTGADGKAYKTPTKATTAPAKTQPEQQPVTLSPAMVEQAPLAVDALVQSQIDENNALYAAADIPPDAGNDDLDQDRLSRLANVMGLTGDDNKERAGLLAKQLAINAGITKPLSEPHIVSLIHTTSVEMINTLLSREDRAFEAVSRLVKILEPADFIRFANLVTTPTGTVICEFGEALITELDRQEDALIVRERKKADITTTTSFVTPEATEAM